MPAAPLGPPPPHLGSSTGSLGRRVSREGVAALRPDLRPPPPRSVRGGREPPRRGRSRHRRSWVEEGAAMPRPEPVPLRPDPVPDGDPPLPPHPGKKEARGEEEVSRRSRIQCRTTPRHCRRALGRRGSGRRMVGEEETGHRVMAARRPQRIRRPRGCSHRRNRRGRPGAEEEGGAGRGRHVQGGGRGRGGPAEGAACDWGEGGVRVG
jgi:hypothetical protein